MWQTVEFLKWTRTGTGTATGTGQMPRTLGPMENS